MKQLEELILDFAEVHPVWIWILARLSFVACIMGAIILACVSVGMFILPFILWIVGDGFQLGWWFIATAPILLCWGCCAAGKWIYKTFIEDL